jgi:acetyl-CoA C-acetyltransferase
MRPISVAGAGKTAFGAFPGRGLKDLAVEAIGAALADAGVPAGVVQALYVGNFDAPSFTGQNHVAPYVAQAAGLREIPATRFEAACASGGSAFFHAAQAVAHGVYDVVLVCGVEKMTSQPTARVAEILAGAGDAVSEAAVGATFPAIFAMIARRHMHEFGTTREHLAAVAVKNHFNASLNPQAHLRKVITMEQALAGKAVADPLTLYDCSLVSDGAAAVILSSRPGAIRVAGIAQASGPVSLADKASLTQFEATQRAAAQAYAQAGIGPKEIDLAEVHDCFTIAELIALEDLGFVARGESGPWVAAGNTALGGVLPVNTSGGLKAKGHPIGATGVAQICDLVLQMRGEAGERQVGRADWGLAQNLGGSGATSVVTILRRQG